MSSAYPIRRLLVFTLDEIQRLPFSMRNEKLAAWEAAPADPAEAADKAGEAAAIRYWEGMRGELEETERMDAEDVGQDVARAVLQALGVPSPQPTRSEGQ